MSLNRTALRLATALALSNNFTAPYPTLAGGRVFDSRLDPIQGIKPEEQVPIIVIYTDDDDGEQLSDNNGGPPFRRMVDLVLWLSICQNAKDGEGNIVIGYTETDAELEAMLDLFEHQVRFAFSNIGNKWSNLLRGTMLRRIKSWKSDRLVAEGNIKLAARNVVVSVEIVDDDLPTVVPQIDEAAELPGNIQEILDAVGPTSTGYVKATVDLLAAAGVPDQIALPDLKTIRMAQTAAPGAPTAEWTVTNLGDVPLVAKPLTVTAPVLGKPTLASS